MNRQKVRIDFEKQREEATLRLLGELKSWPRWPWLPMKRVTGSGVHCAVVHADHCEATGVRLYRGNLFEHGRWFPAQDAAFENFASFAELLAAGWRVD